jgi:hypothetical protein
MDRGASVNRLPRHLKPWARELALFEDDIALVLGTLATQLSGLFGSVELDRASEGTLDGYDGIARRGTYDRLLPTEWLVLEEMPDEFLRRAISGEHSFLQRAYRHTASVKRSVALFDAGIEQLGAPRIAHLAALVVLSQRAERSGAGLSWGILQDTPGSLRGDFARAWVRDFLNGRSARRASRDDIDRWMASEEVRTASEVWIIGAERAAALAKDYRPSTLVISEILAASDTGRLQVTASTPRAARPRAATLEVPPGNIAARLLRDPFRMAVAPRRSARAVVARRSNLLFSEDGKKLYARGINLSLLTLRVPNSPRAAPAPPIVLPPPEGHVIVAVGRSPLKKRALVVCQYEGGFALHTLSKRGAAIAETQWCPDVDPAIPKIPEDAPLVALRAIDAESLSFPLADGYVIDIKGARATLTPAECPTTQRTGAGRSASASPKIDVPAGYEVCEVAQHSSARPLIVAVSNSRTQIKILRADLSQTVVTTASPITAAAAIFPTPDVAFLTRDGDIGVYSCSQEAMILRVTLRREGEGDSEGAP